MVSRRGSAVEESRPMMTVPLVGMGIPLPLSCPFSTTSSGIESSGRQSSTGDSSTGVSRHGFPPVALVFLPRSRPEGGPQKLYKNALENGSPDANMRGPLLHSGLEVLRHAHGQPLHADRRRQLPQAPEVRPGVRPLRRH